ncbi:MAG: hypothetical protein JNN30_08785 [Rhodanobacteraceae bacterium]|nr:hypothetical protein [Rhodanobacteraceae bacterium]
MGVSFQLGDVGMGPPEPDDRRIHGVCPALVISNTDLLTEGRIQIQVPWLPGFLLWARVAVPMAGIANGTFFIPQVGDEVLVAFAQGDVREAYVIGCLWSTTARPPALTPVDPTIKRVIRTPLGHEIAFDESQAKLTITNMALHSVTLGPDGIELATVGGAASIKLGVEGEVSIIAAKSFSVTTGMLDLTAIGDASVSSAALTLDGGASCVVRGGKVNIN